MSGVKFESSFFSGGLPGYLYIPDAGTEFLPDGYRREFPLNGSGYADAAVYLDEILRRSNAGRVSPGYTTWFCSTINYEEMSSEFLVPRLVPIEPGYYQFDEHRRIEIDESSILHYLYDGEELFTFTFTGQFGINSMPWYYPELDENNLYNFGIRTALPIGPDYYYFIVGETPIPYKNTSDDIPIQKLKLFFEGLEIIDPESTDKDPFEDGGFSEEGGGGGNFSEDSDIIDDEELPLKGAVGTGFATIFTPSNGQLRDLSRLFWNADIFAFLQNMVENINSMFTSLGVVPFNVPAGNTVSVTWLGIDTTVALTLAQKQYIEFNMGSINLGNDARIFTSNSALDYSPFSKLGIYLPFIGFRDLDIDECRNCTMGLKYKIDILSGTCVATISLNGNSIYQFSGNCLSQIPITSENMSSLISNVTNVAIAGANAYNAASATQAGLDDLGGKVKEGDIARAYLNISHGESKLASSTANAVLSGKPTFEKTGSVSASAALMSIRQPYLFLTTPRQSLPANYNRYKGYPCNMTAKLGDLSGYTVVEDIRLNGLVATSPEVSEIYELLKGGVII